MNEPTIGLALSGGGSRAIAFHLGCLRALHQLDLLKRVAVLSTVSGGSVIGALYALSEEPFPVFEKRVRAVLRRGLVWPTVRTAMLTVDGPKALMSWALVGTVHIAFLVFSTLVRILLRLASSERRGRWQLEDWYPPVRRFASRTTIFRRALDDELFNGARMNEVPSTKPLLVINAAELRTGSAFYLTTDESGSWRLGRLQDNDVALADAVAASAAYPLLLPSLDERLPFLRRDGSVHLERVTLSDGGVYDNLGLAPLWPDRDPSVSLNVARVDTIICCRAGHGLRRDPPSQFLIARLKSAFTCIHDRAQNASMKRLFELRENGKLRNVILPYLGQNDSRLRFPPADLVTREDTSAYPTDFSAMSAAWVERLSRRGEQITKALIAEHAPLLMDRSR
ncbi:MAG: patatin-like phospholipase family protein [Acidobacteria bacterium]|nr:patatin-like phospholipase family protein [Acidobacteriota bacterium]